MENHIEDFRTAMLSAGLTPPKHIQPGKLHRFPTNGRPRDDAGWYVLHTDGIPAGQFGDFRSGIKGRWRARIGRKLTQDEAVALRRRMEEITRQRKAALAAERLAASERAAQLWKSAAAATADHPYLRRKGIEVHGLRVRQSALIVPVMDDTIVHSLQFIGAAGSKRFLPGGKVSGCYFLIGVPNDVMCIVEGLATGASVHEATGLPVAVAFNATNLVAAGKNLRKRFPNVRMVVCADDDLNTPGNPGRTKAKEAAEAIGALLAVPDFGPTRTPTASDFNDLHQQHGLDAVRTIIEETLRTTDDSSANRFMAGLVRAADLEPRPVEWLWDGWLAADVLHVIAGAPGTGKTTLALALAAILSSGGRWPDGTTAGQGDVVIWSGEDVVDKTLLPRLIAMGANRDRIYFVHDAGDPTGRRPFDPSTDLPQLVAKIRQEKLTVRLLIIDPIVSAVRGDSHKNAETRRALQPLVDFAESEGCAVLGVSHFSKGTAGREVVERVTGSLAFGAVARLVLATAKMPDEHGGGRILVRAKSNLGVDTGGFRYELEQIPLEGTPDITSSRVVWGEALHGTARELLAQAEAPPDTQQQEAVDEAAEWLRETLKLGSAKVDHLKSRALAAGHAWRTVQRAATEKLRVVKKRSGFGRGGAFWWSLPACTPTAGILAKPDEVAHMEPLGAHGEATPQTAAFPGGQCCESCASTHSDPTLRCTPGCERWKLDRAGAYATARAPGRTVAGVQSRADQLAAAVRSECL